MTIAGLRGLLDSEPRLAILGELQRGGAKTAGELGAALGMHENTVRDHVRRLMDAGLLVAEREHRTVRGRPRVYFAWADGVERRSPAADAQTSSALAVGRAYRAMVATAAASGSAEAPASVAGSTSAAEAPAAAQLDVLTDHLERCGFEPEPSGDGLTLHCPFASLYASAGPALCAVHLRVIRSVLERTPGPLRATALDAAPEACRLALEPEPHAA